LEASYEQKNVNQKKEDLLFEAHKPTLKKSQYKLENPKNLTLKLQEEDVLFQLQTEEAKENIKVLERKKSGSFEQSHREVKSPSKVSQPSAKDSQKNRLTCRVNPFAAQKIHHMISSKLQTPK